MAKTKAEKENAALLEAQEKEAVSIVQKEEKNQTGPTYDELLSIVQQLSQEVQSLKSGVTSSDKNDSLASVLSALTNRKSDREITIVHNRELLGGLTTHIDLSNTTIDFKHIGETRLLSWQQFEECTSKYRTFFDRGVILVDGAYAEIAEQYNLPCTKSKEHILTQKEMTNLVNLDVPQLEQFISSLSEEDKGTVFSFWLGKCYTREVGYYDRHKMDTLNRMSNGMFDNILLVMNGDDRVVFSQK